MRFSLTRVLAIAVLLVGAAHAQNEEYPQERNYGQPESSERTSYTRQGAGPFSLRAGVGFASSPTAFLFGVEGDYEIVDQFSLGGHVQVGLDDDVTIVSPLAFMRYRFDLGSMIDEDLARIEPSIRAGVGFSHWDRELPGHDDDDTVFLLNFGTGVEYRFDPHMSIGTLMHFNIMPTDVFDDKRYEDDFYFAWEVLTFRYTF